MFRSAILFISLSNWNFRVDELVSRGNSSVKFPSSTIRSNSIEIDSVFTSSCLRLLLFPNWMSSYLHVYCSMRSWQISHWTSQHHLNLHRHCHFFWNWWMLWPRPQHKRSQLSSPCAVRLHGRSTVPNEPMLRFRSQYCGDGSKCISSKRFGVSNLRRFPWYNVVRSPLS